MKITCPCNSEKEYEECCKQYHEGKNPENAELLMRSRYSAYALNLPNYIVETTHPASPGYLENRFSWKRSLSQFSKDTTFQKLTILDFKEKGSFATVTFTAHLAQEEHDRTFTERSYFEKFQNRWLYRHGHQEAGYAPTLVATGELKLLPLAYLGDPILKKRAEPIAEITEELKKLIEEMVETMDAYDGIGIAAPQIHHSLRLFVIRTPIETDKERFEAGDVQVFINPTLSEFSEDHSEAGEGCLSIPTAHGAVSRPKELSIEYTSLDGVDKKKRVSGWEARVIQHEYDHIEGILFIDRLPPEEQEKLAPHLEKVKKRIHDGKSL